MNINTGWIKNMQDTARSQLEHIANTIEQIETIKEREKTAEWLERLPRKPSKRRLEKVVEIAKNDDYWINREKAMNVLGFTQYKPEVLEYISENDSSKTIRDKANAWIENYDLQKNKYLNLDPNNPFGKVNSRLPWPVEARIGEIDLDPKNIGEYRIGLTRKQITNLGLYKKAPMLLRNWEGEDDITMKINGRKLEVEVYHVPDNGNISTSSIKINKKLARRFRLDLEDTVKLYV
jgi:hypothetical protein